MKHLFAAVGRYIRQTDLLLLFLCLVASSVGFLMISGIIYMEMTSVRNLIMQVIATGLGLIGAVVLSLFDYRTLAGLWKLHVPAAILLVLATLVFGTQRGDADDVAWLIFPITSTFSLSLQPSELLKISYVLSFALHLETVRENINQIKTLIPLCIHGLYPVLLIHIQGDDGTALVFLCVFVSMIFAAGLSWKYICAAAMAAVAAVPIVWNLVMSEDQKNRIIAVLNPGFDQQNIGWQQYQGRISIGSGQIWGIGIFSEEHRTSVPEIQNDFIFAFIGESWGFVGGLFVILLLTAIALRILANSSVSQDYLGKYICVGICSIVIFQMLINIGMCLSILPVIGITLPFISCGGTSVTTLYLGIGLALSVYMHNRTTLFS